MLSELARTKLRPPRLREDVIPRPRLLTALHDAVSSHPLTLVSAPAGYGKTTLLAALPHAFPALPLAWLSLDEEDDEPARFLGALVAALQCLQPACGTTAQMLLASLPNPGAEGRRVVGMLVNDLLETLPGPFALLLDDLHLIAEPAVYATLDYLLERLPPQMHLVVATRHDPPLALARLRARAQLAELRLPNLRFTPDEAAAFLNDRLGLGLSIADLASLHSRTEGWPAGLRLLASSLDPIPTPVGRTAFIAHLARTDRHVFDFLAEEVLGRQSGAVRTFLLETSILPELTPALCQAVAGQPDAPAILEDLYHRNLFLVAVDEASTVYRYHHLFAEFLRRRLAQELPEQVAELHRRAAEAETVPARSVAHYLAARLWEQAAQTVEQVGEQVVREGLLGTLRGWIEALPEPVREAHPRLSYFLGVCALQRGALDEASSLLERAQRGFEAIGNEDGQGDCLLALVDVAAQQHEYERQAELARQALAHPLPAHGRVALLVACVWQLLHQGDLTGAAADLHRALQLALESGEPGAFHALAPILRMPLPLLPGGPERLERYCHHVLARFGEGVGPVQAGAHSLLGYIYLLRGRLDEAVREAERARALSQQLGGFVFLDGEVDAVLAHTAFIRGDYAAVERGWEAGLPWFEQISGIRPWAVAVLYMIGRAQWMQGRFEQARQTYARMCGIVNPHEFPDIRLSRALMRALLEIGDGRYPEAERTLRQAVPIELGMRHCIAFGSARLLLAYLYLRWDRPREALSELGPVLAECERNGTPGLVLQEGAIMVPVLRLAVERSVRPTLAASLLALLDASGAPGPVRVPDTGETLTPREVEVLRLIAAGASNQAIARQLVISERTVKAHVTHLLGKLRASSRTQAVARARDLHLV
ncbi:MAG: tetratricopeptide repeat protein [Chloroflexi bacterium]|nr:tetratricopeptide repeat protein [Chloroflexota bacterium]